MHDLLRSLEAGRAGPGVFLAQQVLPGWVEKGRDFLEKGEGVNYLEGVLGGSAIPRRGGMNFWRSFHSRLKLQMSLLGQEVGGPQRETGGPCDPSDIAMLEKS